MRSHGMDPLSLPTGLDELQSTPLDAATTPWEVAGGVDSCFEPAAQMRAALSLSLSLPLSLSLYVSVYIYIYLSLSLLLKLEAIAFRLEAGGHR